MLQVGQHLFDRHDPRNAAEPAKEFRAHGELGKCRVVIDHHRQVTSLGHHPVVPVDFLFATAPVIGWDQLLSVVAHLAGDLGELQRLQGGCTGGHGHGEKVCVFPCLLKHDCKRLHPFSLAQVQELADTGGGDDAVGTLLHAPIYLGA